ncbi:MAG: trimethylamine methyltransferase family protein [Candidatus Thorarchaeota archaeon]
MPTGIVLTQLGSEGAPFIYGAMQSIMDMKTTVGSYRAVELHLLITAASEIADYYELPFYVTAGCTDAKMLDTLRFLEIWKTENRGLTI